MTPVLNEARAQGRSVEVGRGGAWGRGKKRSHGRGVRARVWPRGTVLGAQHRKYRVGVTLLLDMPDARSAALLAD